MAHKHTVRDTNAHFIIDQFTRQVKNDSANKTTIVQYDHNSERLTFEMPLYIDGHAMTLCNLIELHFINISANGDTQHPGTYEVTDIKAEGDKAIFTWLISQEATQLVGSLNFLIVFKCVEDGVTVYRWSTEIFKNLSVSSGMDNGEAVLTEYPDILAQWKTQLFDASDTAVSNVATAEASALSAIEAAGEAKKQSVLDSIPDEYEALSALVDQSHRNKAGAVVLDAEGKSIVLKDASEYPLQNLKLFGKSTQDGTPTPEAPIDIVSSGNGKSVKVFSCGKNLIDTCNPVRTVQCTAEAIGNQLLITRTNTKESYSNVYFTAGAYSMYVGKTLSLQVTNTTDLTWNFRVGNFVDNTIADSGCIVIVGVAKGETKTVTFVVPENADGAKLGIRITSDNNSVADGSTCIIKNFQLEIGENATEYECYKTAQEVDLTSVPVLCGVSVSVGGNHVDTDGQKWFCDDVDCDLGAHTQRVNKYIVTGEEDWYISAQQHFTGDGYYRYDVNTSCDKPAIITDVLCSHFPYLGTNKKGAWALNEGVVLSLRIVGQFTTVDELKAFLSEQFTAGSPVTFYYATSPIETPLSDVEIAAFKALHSNKPNTTILNDAGAYMAVDYVADTKTYIDNKIKKLMEGVTA